MTHNSTYSIHYGTGKSREFFDFSRSLAEKTPNTLDEYRPYCGHFLSPNKELHTWLSLTRLSRIRGI